ncbi:MAG: NAD(P)H-dependent oxidoreductase [Candidatus Paceibacterota bacterium]|jgi:nitroreductase
MKTIHDALMWRYATKQFDPTKKLPEETLNQILEAGCLSPSSFGLQPWKFVLVENPELRAQLRTVGYNQPQITDASHIIIIAYKNTLDEDYVDSYMKSTADVRGISIDDLATFKAAILGSVSGKSSEDIKKWNSRQVYIPLGIMLEAAALLEVDACPMEGFDSVKFDELLGLNDLGYSSVAMMALGYRSESDATALATKSRFSKEEIVLRK